MARETLSGVKKKYQKELGEIKKAVWLKCADCQGYFVDGYFACLDKKCPLRSSYPPERTIASPNFKKMMGELAKSKKNDQEFLEKILPGVRFKKYPLKKRPSSSKLPSRQRKQLRKASRPFLKKSKKARK